MEDATSKLKWRIKVDVDLCEITRLFIRSRIVCLVNPSHLVQLRFNSPFVDWKTRLEKLSSLFYIWFIDMTFPILFSSHTLYLKSPKLL